MAADYTWKVSIPALEASPYIEKQCLSTLSQRCPILLISLEGKQNKLTYEKVWLEMLYTSPHQVIIGNDATTAGESHQSSVVDEDSPIS